MKSGQALKKSKWSTPRLRQQALKIDKHHVFNDKRARKLGFTGLKNIPGNLIKVLHYLHYAFHLAFGNATIEEAIAWIKEGKVNLRSEPCIILFGKNATPGTAVTILKRDWAIKTHPVTKEVRDRFARHPYTYAERWGKHRPPHDTEKALQRLRLLVEALFLHKISAEILERF